MLAFPVARAVRDCEQSDDDVVQLTLQRSAERGEVVHIDGVPIAVESAFGEFVPEGRRAMDPGGQSAAVSMLHGAASGSLSAQYALNELAPYSNIAASASGAACVASYTLARSRENVAQVAADVAQNRVLATMWMPWVQQQATAARDLIQGTPAEVAAAYASIANPPAYGCGSSSQGPTSMFVQGALPVSHGQITPGAQTVHADTNVSMYAAANAAAAGDIALAQYAAAGGPEEQTAARNASWGLEPETVVMGQLPNNEYTPRALVSNAPPETRTSMQLEAYVARSMPHAWGRWPETVPEWAIKQQMLSADGKRLVMAHPLLATASPIMPNSGGVGPVLASLVTPFAGGALSTIYGFPYAEQYEIYPQLAPRALPVGQIPVPRTQSQITSIPSAPAFTTMRTQ